MTKEFEGVGLTPFDPYHNSTYVVAGKQPTYCFSEGTFCWSLFVSQSLDWYPIDWLFCYFDGEPIKLKGGSTECSKGTK